MAVMKITSVELEKRCRDPKDFPRFRLPEIAFAGRSNVGKSSLINTLLTRKRLVAVSSTPGKTRAIDFFRVNDIFRFVDLPGYGYAKVPKTVQNAWKQADRRLSGRPGDPRECRVDPGHSKRAFRTRSNALRLALFVFHPVHPGLHEGGQGIPQGNGRKGKRHCGNHSIRMPTLCCFRPRPVSGRMYCGRGFGLPYPMVRGGRVDDEQTADRGL